jgi:hypothetical protein
MEEDRFYIAVEDRFYYHDGYTSDYHLEKIFDKEQVLDNIESKLRGRNVIVTNDKDLLCKYIKAINEYEFKMLCEFENDDFKLGNYDFRLDEDDYFEIDNNVNVKIRINPKYFGSFSSKAFEYFLRIKRGELVSASMDFIIEKIDTWEEKNPHRGVIDYEYFSGWVENKKFSYLKTPIRYLNKENTNTLFYFKDVKKADLKELENLVNFNITEIFESKLDFDKNWHWEKGVLKYYDKISCKRLYIAKNHFDKIAENNDLVLMIDTRLDRNFYIEYHVTGFESQESVIGDNNFESRNHFQDNDSYKYEKYKGAYGFDDDTIDNAFEGDPENYWNID